MITYYNVMIAKGSYYHMLVIYGKHVIVWIKQYRMIHDQTIDRPYPLIGVVS